MQNVSKQTSKLLPSLFKNVDEGELVTVFHVGSALPETVDFFSKYRCKLHFVDLFSALPITYNCGTKESLEHQLEQAITFSSNTRFDVCFFWDLFNYLDSEAISAFLTALQPYLKESTVAHAFSVHNLKTGQNSHLYGVYQADILSFKDRRTALPGYSPHSQNQLKQLLHCFSIERSVLLNDSRLELLLQARLDN